MSKKHLLEGPGNRHQTLHTTSADCRQMSNTVASCGFQEIQRNPFPIHRTGHDRPSDRQIDPHNISRPPESSRLECLGMISEMTKLLQTLSHPPSANREKKHTNGGFPTATATSKRAPARDARFTNSQRIFPAEKRPFDPRSAMAWKS